MIDLLALRMGQWPDTIEREFPARTVNRLLMLLEAQALVPELSKAYADDEEGGARKRSGRK